MFSVMLLQLSGNGGSNSHVCDMFLWRKENLDVMGLITPLESTTPRAVQLMLSLFVTCIVNAVPMRADTIASVLFSTYPY